ncbi:symmetrical bis(5'-nucleosyl)-tetraphosphatase [Acidihalobacter prosperus]
MAVYVVGDLQGCLSPLERLLKKVDFNPQIDRLWLVGDLVNRGPSSLETLRFVKDLGPAANCVLGNHDLHLLAIAAGIGSLRHGDTLQPILEAPDADELLIWLRTRPLIHHDALLGWTMVHAGIPPQWDIPFARLRAAEVETELRTNPKALFNVMYGDLPHLWSEDLDEASRHRFTLNALTRMRYVHTDDGRLDYSCKASPDKAPKGLVPWFRSPTRENNNARVVFGHWSTLGLINEPDLIALDTGCVWGGKLSLIRLDLDNHPVLSTDCTKYQPLGI